MGNNSGSSRVVLAPRAGGGAWSDPAAGAFARPDHDANASSRDLVHAFGAQGRDAYAILLQVDAVLERAGVPAELRLLTGPLSRLEEARRAALDLIDGDDREQDHTAPAGICPGDDWGVWVSDCMDGGSWVGPSVVAESREGERLSPNHPTQDSGPVLSPSADQVLRVIERSHGDVPQPILSRIHAMLGRGAPLDHEQQTRFSLALDHDLSHVRVHIGGAASQVAEAVSAHAFTVGSDVFFGMSEYAPGTPEGDRLLAHELTHVVQHDTGRLPRAGGVSSPSDPAEQEAYSNEDRVLGALDRPEASDEATAPSLPSPLTTEGPSSALDQGDTRGASQPAEPSVTPTEVSIHRNPTDLTEVWRSRSGPNWRTDRIGDRYLVLLSRQMLERLPDGTTSLSYTDHPDLITAITRALFELARTGRPDEEITRIAGTVIVDLPPRPWNRGSEWVGVRVDDSLLRLLEAPVSVDRPPEATDEEPADAQGPPATHDQETGHQAPAPPREAAQGREADRSAPPTTSTAPAEGPAEPPATPTQAPTRMSAQAAPSMSLEERRTRAQDVISDFSNYNPIDDRSFGIDEAALGDYLAQAMIRGDIQLTRDVLDQVSWSDADDVAVEIIAGLTDEQMTALLDDPRSASLLYRLFDDVTTGRLGDDERSIAERISRAVMDHGADTARGSDALPRLVVPYATVTALGLTTAVVSARLLPDGQISVNISVAGFSELTQQEQESWNVRRSGLTLELPASELVTIKDLTAGGRTETRPALFLLQLTNTQHYDAAGVTLQAAFTGATLPFSGGVSAGARSVQALRRLGVSAGRALQIIGAADVAAAVMDPTCQAIVDNRNLLNRVFGEDGTWIAEVAEGIGTIVGVYGWARQIEDLGSVLTDWIKRLRDRIRRARADLRSMPDDADRAGLAALEQELTRVIDGAADSPGEPPNGDAAEVSTEAHHPTTPGHAAPSEPDQPTAEPPASTQDGPDDPSGSATRRSEGRPTRLIDWNTDLVAADGNGGFTWRNRADAHSQGIVGAPDRHSRDRNTATREANLAYYLSSRPNRTVYLGDEAYRLLYGEPPGTSRQPCPDVVVNYGSGNLGFAEAKASNPQDAIRQFEAGIRQAMNGSHSRRRVIRLTVGLEGPPAPSTGFTIVNNLLYHDGRLVTVGEPDVSLVVNIVMYDVNNVAH